MGFRATWWAGNKMCLSKREYRARMSKIRSSYLNMDRIAKQKGKKGFKCFQSQEAYPVTDCYLDKKSES